MSEKTAAPNVVVVTTESPSESSEQSSQEREEAIELGKILEAHRTLSNQCSELMTRVEILENRQGEMSSQLGTLSGQTAEILGAVELAKAEAIEETATENEEVEPITPPEPEPEPEPESEPEVPKVTAPKWARMLLGGE